VHNKTTFLVSTFDLSLFVRMIFPGSQPGPTANARPRVVVSRTTFCGRGEPPAFVLWAACHGRRLCDLLPRMSGGVCCLPVLSAPRCWCCLEVLSVSPERLSDGPVVSSRFRKVCGRMGLPPLSGQ
jgi:hypothetical protein